MPEALQLARTLTAEAKTARDQGNLDASIKLYEEAADIYRSEGAVLRLAHTIRHAGDILREQGRLDLAGPRYEEALSLYRVNERTPPLDLANAIRGFALLKDALGQSGEARLLWEEAKDLYARVDVQAGVDECCSRLA